MEFIEVPNDLGGDLRNDIEGVCRAELTKLNWGVSKKNQPKVTIEFTLVEDIDNIEPPTMGAKVLETCSLQSQALWKVNSYYKGVTGEDMAAGKMTYEEFKIMMENTLLGTSWDLDLMIGTDEKNEPRTQVRTANYIG